MSYSRDNFEKEPHLSTYGTFTLMGTNRLKTPDGLTHIRKNFVYQDNFIPFSFSLIFDDEANAVDFFIQLKETFKTFELHLIAHQPNLVYPLTQDEERYSVAIVPKESTELYAQTHRDPMLYHHIILSVFERYVDIAKIPQIDWSVHHSRPLEEVKAGITDEADPSSSYTCRTQ